MKCVAALGCARQLGLPCRLQMTGLDVEKDVIIEIAVIITDGQLHPVDEGIEYIIRTDKEVLDA